MPGHRYNPNGAHAHTQSLAPEVTSASSPYAFDGAWQSHIPQRLNTRVAETDVQPTLPRVSNARFHPYAQLFFNHLFPIMPVIDPKVYLDNRLYDQTNVLTSEVYAFLCALSAATIVQLDASVPLPPFDSLPGRPISEAEMFSEECLRTRREYDYIRHPTALTILTSFFIFAYYGNDEGEKSERAWHYLQESISFAEVLDLDNEGAVSKFDGIEAQWKRRLFWLLFVTERFDDQITPSSFMN